MMSKYDPLRRYLEGATSEELPLTFAEVEGVLGFRLPPSAKAHATWWSNNTGTHVGVRAWRDAGWKTSRVDLGSERVVFVRSRQDTAAPRATGDCLMVPRARLSIAAAKLLDDYTAEASGDIATAVSRAIHEAAIARRGRYIDGLTARAPRVTDDSVDLIREDRDAR